MSRPARSQPAGARAVRGSDAARRQAALLLEAWSGVRSTQSASEAMGVALTRFYQLEARALQLVVSAMEPRPRGRQTTVESQVAKCQGPGKRDHLWFGQAGPLGDLIRCRAGVREQNELTTAAEPRSGAVTGS